MESAFDRFKRMFSGEKTPSTSVEDVNNELKGFSSLDDTFEGGAASGLSETTFPETVVNTDETVPMNNLLTLSAYENLQELLTRAEIRGEDIGSSKEIGEVSSKFAEAFINEKFNDHFVDEMLGEGVEEFMVEGDNNELVLDQVLIEKIRSLIKTDSFREHATDVVKGMVHSKVNKDRPLDELSKVLDAKLKAEVLRKIDSRIKLKRVHEVHTKKSA